MLSVVTCANSCFAFVSATLVEDASGFRETGTVGATAVDTCTFGADGSAAAWMSYRCQRELRRQGWERNVYLAVLFHSSLSEPGTQVRGERDGSATFIDTDFSLSEPRSIAKSLYAIRVRIGWSFTCPARRVKYPKTRTCNLVLTRFARHSFYNCRSFYITCHLVCSFTTIVLCVFLCDPFQSPLEITSDDGKSFVERCGVGTKSGTSGVGEIIFHVSSCHGALHIFTSVWCILEIVAQARIQQVVSRKRAYNGRIGRRPRELAEMADDLHSKSQLAGAHFQPRKPKS